MSELDKIIDKIDDIIGVQEGVSLDYYLMSDDYSVEKLKADIKQAFIDDGWKPPTIKMHAHLDLTKNEDNNQNIMNLMTGKEFYDKFSEELKLLDMHPFEGYVHFRTGKVLLAAKKAAGIE